MKKLFSSSNLKFFIMKRSINLKSTVLLVAFVFAVSLIAFAHIWGGDIYEIYVDHKLVLHEIVYKPTGIKQIELDQSRPDAVVDINYSHCGMIGKSRTLLIKDASGNVLSKFNYPDASGAQKYMTCTVRDFMKAQKQNNNSFYLYYSSKELPEGRMLALVVMNNSTASIR